MLNKIKNLIKKSVLSNTVDDSGNYSRAQVSYFGKTSQIETIYPYGLYAVAPIGSEVIIFSIMGQEENLAGIPNAPSVRIKNLKEGEVAIGNPFTQSFIKFDQDGKAILVAKDDISFSAGKNFELEAKETIKLKGNDVQLITPTGTMSLSGGNSQIESQTLNTVTSGDSHFKSGETLTLEGKDVKIIKDGVLIDLGMIAQAIDLATDALIDNNKQDLIKIEQTINKIQETRLLEESASNNKFIEINKSITNINSLFASFQVSVTQKQEQSFASFLSLYDQFISKLSQIDKKTNDINIYQESDIPKLLNIISEQTKQIDKLISDSISKNPIIAQEEIINKAVQKILLMQERAYPMPCGGWTELLGEVNVRGGGSSPSFAVFRNGIYAYSFPANGTTEIFINFHVPHDYTLGTRIYPHVHWSTTGTNTGSVVWGMEYTYARGYGVDAFPVTQTTSITQAFTGTQYAHMIAEPSEGNGLLIPNMEADGVVLFRVYRDGSAAGDTQTQSAFMFYCDFHYYSSGTFTNERNRTFTPRRGY